MVDHREAFKRVGLTLDGRAINYFLQQILMSTAPDTKSGALRTFEGKRQLARELKTLLEQGYAEQPSDGYADPATDDAIVRLARAEPVAYAKPGTGRRVKPYAESADS